MDRNQLSEEAAAMRSMPLSQLRFQQERYQNILRRCFGMLNSSCSSFQGNPLLIMKVVQAKSEQLALEIRRREAYIKAKFVMIRQRRLKAERQPSKMFVDNMSDSETDDGEKKLPSKRKFKKRAGFSKEKRNQAGAKAQGFVLDDDDFSFSSYDESEAD